MPETATLAKAYRRSLLPILSGSAFAILLLLAYLSSNSIISNFLQRLEAIPYDIRLKLTTPVPVLDTPPIVIVDIDEASLKKIGRWPWSRIKMAQLINRLNESGAAVIALDILQSEAEQNPVSRIRNLASEFRLTLDQPAIFETLERKVNPDQLFADSLAGKDIVLGYPFHSEMLHQQGALPKSAVVAAHNTQTEQLTVRKMAGYTAPLEILTKNAATSGFFSVSPDPDGIVRHAALVVAHAGKVYPSLALETARLYLLEEEIRLQTKKIGEAHTLTHVVLGKTRIPTDATGRMLIPYRGKEKQFSYVAAHRVLDAGEPLEELQNAIVLIGTSAKGLVDSRTTPLQSGFPGVEIHANLLHAILHPQTIRYVPDWESGATVAQLALLMLVMVVFYPLLQPLWLVINGTGLLLLTFLFNGWLWQANQLYLPVVPPLLLVMAVSSLFVVHHLLRENRDRRRIHAMFGQYVPVDHINRLIDNPQQVSTQGEKRRMSVLFSDIRSFTAISEPLSTRELKTFLNNYLTPITEIIFNHQGTIDKYVGDMVMAFWGAPLKNRQHARDAVLAALDMQQKIKQMQPEFSSMGLPEVSAGIGIHTGFMNVGDMGSDFRRAYTVLGDAVNLGSRLEGLTKFYGVKILVSEDTLNDYLVKSDSTDTKKSDHCTIIFRYIDHIRAKGKQDAIRIYEPVGPSQSLDRMQQEQLVLHEKAMKHFREKNLEQAKIEFEQLKEMSGESLYTVYLERICAIESGKMADWDGIFSHTTK